MAQFNVAVIVGSLRKESFNLKLAKALVKLGQGKLEGKILNFGDLPLFSQDLEANVPEAVTRFKQDIQSADAVLFVTPEYNRSIPGPLKNAIDWASRPYGKNSFAHKPAALCGTSQGALGTSCSQHSLRPVLSYLELALMGQPEVYFQFKEGLIDGEGNISNEDTKKFLQGFVDKFVVWIENHTAAAPQAKRANG